MADDKERHNEEVAEKPAISLSDKNPRVKKTNRLLYDPNSRRFNQGMAGPMNNEQSKEETDSAAEGNGEEPTDSLKKSDATNDSEQMSTGSENAPQTGGQQINTNTSARVGRVLMDKALWPKRLKLYIILGIAVVVVLFFIIFFSLFSSMMEDDKCVQETDAGWWWPLGTDCEETGGKTFCYGEPSMVTVTDPMSSYRELTHAPHQGMDIGATRYTSIIAPKSGKVLSTSDGAGDGNINVTSNKCGNSVFIDHGNGITVLYCHMQKGTVIVKPGDEVTQGQKIGEVGASGQVTGPHLHFELRLHGTAMNPLNYLNMDDTRPGKTVCVQDYTADQQGACLFLKDNGFSNEGAAGILTNLKHESGFITNNMENCYETGNCCSFSTGVRYGYCTKGHLIGTYGNDEAYTAGVDSGAYKNFKIDRVGYGLIQWTDSGRKGALYDYYQELKSAGEASSIADMNVQLGYLMKELQEGYPNLYDAIKNSSSARDSAERFCREFERPDGCSSRMGYVSEMLSYVQNGCK